MGRADARDGGEGEVEDGDLDEAGQEGGGHLGGEHLARGDFHVVAAVRKGAGVVSVGLGRVRKEGKGGKVEG